MTGASLIPLPLELWGLIAGYLSNADLKSLRLTCTKITNAVPLRINRVFLSANPLNIDVFRKIASHEQFRHLVTEVIWDEARLPRGPPRMNTTSEGHELLSDEDEPNNTRAGTEFYYKETLMGQHKDEDQVGCPKWFKDDCDENLRVLRSRKGADIDRPEHVACREQIIAQPPLKECWQHYQHLLSQQNEVLTDDSDLEAFLFGVKQFPALKRVTFTPVAHGFIFNPLYPTPMIRAFPKGFNYPIPYGWLYDRSYEKSATAYPWNHNPELKGRYRGFCNAMRVLANEPNSVSELVMTSNFVPTGINCTIFDEPCEEYDDFVKVLKNPGFRRLDISLLVGGEDDQDLEPCWRSLLNGRLRSALSGATEMEEFRLHTTFDEDIHANDLYPLIPLNGIVPVEKWLNLRHFELSGFVISQDDFILFFSTLPTSIKSIELSMLAFHDWADWYSIINEIRRMVSESTPWRDLNAASRPIITIGMSDSLMPEDYGRATWTEKEVQEFVYGDGENPIKESFPVQTPEGIGILKDAFDPSFERPNVSWSDLERLKIHKEHWNPYEY
ncbi:unnamed protein product [Penicillium salamii]|uniref:F-box domain-containing protein n=1 Tax=Penicillium salamii TaxID=1612424 RepID=A0A9W4JJQ1_9EURO|nr:unnamed protein product [Penicillium salamii]CAG8129678.1 unnamed protein product [Penicillium salamii]CAG8362953.1 unnamed protein product [Penicillium salamii]CAG8364317.1 unnamed protein product [Penicillium salamii]CAG8390548.1 unnamed protein product [Penicillium salamii]